MAQNLQQTKSLRHTAAPKNQHIAATSSYNPTCPVYSDPLSSTNDTWPITCFRPQIKIGSISLSLLGQPLINYTFSHRNWLSFNNRVSRPLNSPQVNNACRFIYRCTWSNTSRLSTWQVGWVEGPVLRMLFLLLKKYRIKILWQEAFYNTHILFIGMVPIQLIPSNMMLVLSNFLFILKTRSVKCHNHLHQDLGLCLCNDQMSIT